MDYQKSNEKKLSHSENLNDLERIAKDEFLKLFDEIKTAKEDRRKAHLSSFSKGKIKEFYNRVFVRQIREMKKYHLIVLSLLLFAMHYQPIFNLVDNARLNSFVLSLLFFVISCFSLIFFQSERNIENFFYRMYGDIGREKNSYHLVREMRNFLFSKTESKEYGYRKVITLTILFLAVSTVGFFKPNFNYYALSFVLFCIFIMMQEKTNNVLKNI